MSEEDIKCCADAEEGEDCSCCEDSEDDDCACCEGDEDMDVEEVAHSANNKVDALIGLLISKNLIKEEDLQKEYDKLFEE